jgi:hypothetical protein
MTGAQYMAYLTSVYNAVKAINPAILVGSARSAPATSPDQTRRADSCSLPTTG